MMVTSRRGANGPMKQHVCQVFMAGRTIADIAGYYCVNKLTVEQAIREGMNGLVKLAVPQPSEVGTEPFNVPSDVEIVCSEAVLTPNDGQIA